MNEEEKNGLTECFTSDSAEERPHIQKTTIKIMVSAYLLWIIEQIMTAVIKENTDGAAPLPLILACVFLFAGVCWLLVPEFMKWYCSRKQDK